VVRKSCPFFISICGFVDWWIVNCELLRSEVAGNFFYVLSVKASVSSVVKDSLKQISIFFSYFDTTASAAKTLRTLRLSDNLYKGLKFA
jgi:hypothetical protein